MWIPEDEKRREEKREEKKKKQMVRRDSTNHLLRPRYNYNTIRVGKGQGTFTLSPATVDFVYWIYHRSPDFHPTATSIPRVSLRQDPPATGGGKVQNHPALCRCLDAWCLWGKLWKFYDSALPMVLLRPVYHPNRPDRPSSAVPFRPPLEPWEASPSSSITIVVPLSVSTHMVSPRGRVYCPEIGPDMLS